MLLASCGGGNAGGTAAATGGTPQAGSDWILPGETYAFNRYDNFSDITPSNVTSLKKAWVTQLADDGEQESSPIAYHGTVYIATSHDNVLALDGRTGKVQWDFFYQPAYVLAYAVNRGVGLSGGRIFIGTQDCHVIALNAATGKQE